MICMNKNTVFVVIVVLIVGCFFGMQYFQSHNLNLSFIKEKMDNLQESLTTRGPMTVVPPNTILRTPQQLNSLDRVYNPLRYPYKSSAYYNQNWTPALALPPQVIGCGGRNTPCLGGTQVPIVNPTYPLDYSNNNIAPINIRTRGPLGEPQQVGSIYKLYGDKNEVLPLFGRKKYPNGDRNWEYYTMAGKYGVKMRIVSKRKGDELGTNDVVFINGYGQSPYRVTLYETDFPQYIPYL